MAQAVVHGLEVVEVDEEHGELRVGRSGIARELLEAFTEPDPVGEAGQRIVVREVIESVLEQLGVVQGAFQ